MNCLYGRIPTEMQLSVYGAETNPAGAIKTLLKAETHIQSLTNGVYSWLQNTVMWEIAWLNADDVE
jgi:hypothetical protein